MTIRETILGPTHHASWIPDCVVETLHLEAARVTLLKLESWEGAESTVAVEAECFLQRGASGGAGAGFGVADGEFFTRGDGADGVDCLGFCVIVPVVVGVWETAVVEEANGRVDTANRGVGTARQSVGSDNPAEGLLAGEIIMKRKELALLGL